MEKKFVGWESPKYKLGTHFKIPTPILAFTPSFIEAFGEPVIQVSCVIADPTHDTILVKAYKKRVPFTEPFELPAERLYAVPTIGVESGKPYIDWLIVEVVPPEKGVTIALKLGQG